MSRPTTPGCCFDPLSNKYDTIKCGKAIYNGYFSTADVRNARHTRICRSCSKLVRQGALLQ
jgi:hypothetical protein